MTYEAKPDPKSVVAVGDCAARGGMFGCSYASRGKIANVISVDVVVHGYPRTPTDMRCHMANACRGRRGRRARALNWMAYDQVVYREWLRDQSSRVVLPPS
jgi:Ni,Fe-hydrogenase III small subunit